MQATRRCGWAGALLVLAASLVGCAEAFFLAPSSLSRAAASASASSAAVAARPAAVARWRGAVPPLRASAEAAESERQVAVRERLSQEWELDCYSRPVVGEDGKKLWELLICDSLGEFRAVETMPSNMVNSRELRKLVEKVRDCVPV